MQNVNTKSPWTQEYWNLFCDLNYTSESNEYRTQALLRSYDLAPRPPPPPSHVSKLSLFVSLPVYCRSSLLTGGGGGGVRGNQLYDGERAWAFINHSILSGTHLALHCFPPSVSWWQRNNFKGTVQIPEVGYFKWYQFHSTFLLSYQFLSYNDEYAIQCKK